MAEGGGGVNFTDSSGSSYSYPSWATEETLTSVQSMLQGTPRYHSFMQKFATKMAYGGGDIADAMKHAAMGMEGYAEEVAAAKGETEGLTVSTGRASGSTFSLARTAGMASTRLSEFANSAARSDTSLKSTFDMVAKFATMFTDAAADTISGLGKVGGFFGGATKTLVGMFTHSMAVVMGIADDFGQSLRKTGDLGVSFGESFIDLRQDLAKAGLGLENMEKQLALNSTAFALMGKNVHEGIQEWAKWRKEMIRGTDMDFFRNLGFTLEDFNDYLLKDIRNRILSGRAMGDVTNESADALKWLAKETKAVSELTGESRKKMVAEQIRLQSDPKWLAFLSNMDPEAAKAMDKSLGQIQRLYGFNEKQMDAVQDAIRMGGDVSLLADVFGDQFADYKYMPDALNDIQGVIKDVAQGNAMTDQEWRDRAADFNVKVIDFFDSSTGQWLSAYGQSLINMQGNLFTQYVASTVRMKNEEAFRAGTSGLDYGLQDYARTKEGATLGDNMFLLATENIAMLLSQAFIGPMLEGPQKVIGELLGDIVRARQTGNEELYDNTLAKMEKIMAGLGGGYGKFVEIMSTMGFDAVKAAVPMVEDVVTGIGKLWNIAEAFMTAEKVEIHAAELDITKWGGGNKTTKGMMHGDPTWPMPDANDRNWQGSAENHGMVLDRDVIEAIAQNQDRANEFASTMFRANNDTLAKIPDALTELFAQYGETVAATQAEKFGLPNTPPPGSPLADMLVASAASKEIGEYYMNEFAGTRLEYNNAINDQTSAIEKLKETMADMGIKHGELLEQFVALSKEGNKARKEVALNTKNLVESGVHS